MRFPTLLVGLLIAGTFVSQVHSGEAKPDAGAAKTPAATTPAAKTPAAKAPAAKPEESVEETIRRQAREFVDAFDRGDAKSIADTWTPDGEYVDELGRKYVGREAIEKQYADFFSANPGLKIEIAVQSVRLLAVGTAVEEGAATIVSDQAGPLASSHYTAVHVKQDGKWLAASVRESEAQPLSNYPRLIDFEWLIGDWSARQGDTTIRTTFHWTANRQFLARSFSATEGDVVVLTGMQVIGWDPIAGCVTSWIFDSDGGHGTGTWTRRPNGWSVNSHGVLRDGTRTSATYLFTRLDDNSVAWKSIDRKAGDVELPDTEQVVLKRVVEPKPTGGEKPQETTKPDNEKKPATATEATPANSAKKP